MPETWQHHRARIASLSRDRTADDPELIEARRSLRAERLATHIRDEVAKWPPLTADQINRIAVLLHGGGSDAA